MLPLAKIAFESQAHRALKSRDDTPLDLLARLSGGFARPPKFPAGLVSETRIGPVRREVIQVG